MAPETPDLGTPPADVPKPAVSAVIVEERPKAGDPPPTPAPPSPIVVHEERWWERSAVKAAFFTTLLLLVQTARKIRALPDGADTIDPWLDYGEQLVALWGAALGVTAGAPGLRRAALLVAVATIPFLF